MNQTSTEPHETITTLACPIPEPGTLAEVAPGVRWLRMPLPFALDHVNLWVLDDRDEHGEPGLTLVDTGLDSPVIRDAWTALFDGPLAGDRVLRVICTHFHPDHMGLARWLCDRFSVPLWATLGEWATAQVLLTTQDPWADDRQGAFYHSHGVNAETCAKLKERALGYRTRATPPPDTFHRMVNGDKIRIGERTWQVLTCLGHAPEHACLLGTSSSGPVLAEDRPVFIAGDQVLPGITPNISVWPQNPDADPLSQYLASLQHLANVLPADSLVLPSHKRPFTGVHARLKELLSHHDERLAAVRDACGQPCSAMDLLPVLFRRTLDTHQLGFALGESIAHLHTLWQRGTLLRFQDDHGVYRFIRPESSALSG